MNSTAISLNDIQPPLVAILRGLTPAEAPAVGRLLFAAGFRLLEVPLNRPGALECILDVAAIAPADALVGGGTVLTPDDVDAVHASGGRLIVSPNCDPTVIRRAVELGMLCAPGVATPTEAFAALKAGAHALKIFPAEVVGPAGLKAMRSVLPPEVPVWPVGGVAPGNMAAYVAAGASGFGIGGQLYQPGMDLRELELRAAEFMAAWRATQHR